jgi:hypothetical protein
VIRAVLHHAGLGLEPFPFGRCPRTLVNHNARWLSTASSRDLAGLGRIQVEGGAAASRRRERSNEVTPRTVGGAPLRMS